MLERRDTAEFNRTGAGAARRTQRVRPPASGGLWFRALIVLLVAASACYVSVPVTGVAPEGSTLILTLNDRGRVGLGDSIGAAASQIEGRLQSETDSTYDLRIAGVAYLNQQFNRWSGERFTVPKQFVSSVNERRLSRSRTFLVAGGAVAGAVAFIATRGFGVFGSPGNGGRPGPPGDEQ